MTTKILDKELLEIWKELDPKLFERILMMKCLVRLQKEIDLIRMECYPGREYGQFIDKFENIITSAKEKLRKNENLFSIKEKDAQENQRINIGV